MFVWIFAVIVIIVAMASVGGKYEQYADNARKKYLEEHLTEFKKFNISEQKARNVIKQDKNEDSTVLITFFMHTIAVGIIVCLTYLFGIDGGEEAKSAVKNYWGNMAVISWGFITAISGVFSLSINVEKRIYEHLESYRCPFCKSPLSYFVVDTYKDGEQYYQKKVKKYDSSLKVSSIETQNWVKYKEHKIYKCDYCRKTRDVVQDMEERVDGIKFSGF